MGRKAESLIKKELQVRARSHLVHIQTPPKNNETVTAIDEQLQEVADWAIRERTAKPSTERPYERQGMSHSSRESLVGSVLAKARGLSRVIIVISRISLGEGQRG